MVNGKWRSTTHLPFTICHLPSGLELLAQTELPDDLLVPRAVLAREVLEQGVSLADHLEQPAAGRVVLLMRLKVLVQLGDALGQQCDLHFGRARVFLVSFVFGNDALLRFNTDRHRKRLLDTKSPAVVPQGVTKGPADRS